MPSYPFPLCWSCSREWETSRSKPPSPKGTGIDSTWLSSIRTWKASGWTDVWQKVGLAVPSQRHFLWKRSLLQRQQLIKQGWALPLSQAWWPAIANLQAESLCTARGQRALPFWAQDWSPQGLAWAQPTTQRGAAQGPSGTLWTTSGPLPKWFLPTKMGQEAWPALRRGQDCPPTESAGAAEKALIFKGLRMVGCRWAVGLQSHLNHLPPNRPNVISPYRMRTLGD